MSRAETGVMQFGDDWPGVFIRGDNAAYYASSLQEILEGKATQMSVVIAKGLLDLLQSSNVKTKPEVTKLRPFHKCSKP